MQAGSCGMLNIIAFLVLSPFPSRTIWVGHFTRAGNAKIGKQDLGVNAFIRNMFMYLNTCGLIAHGSVVEIW